jgi:hypothetical protein
MHGFCRSLNSYAGSYNLLRTRPQCPQASSPLAIPSPVLTRYQRALFSYAGQTTLQTNSFSVYNALRLKYGRTTLPSPRDSVYRTYTPEPRLDKATTSTKVSKLPPRIHCHDSLRQYEKGYWRIDPDDIAKQGRPSPSETLIEALYGIGKGDLVEPTLQNARFDRKTRSRNSWRRPQRWKRSAKAGMSLQSITAKFIRWEAERPLQKLDANTCWEHSDQDSSGLFTSPGLDIPISLDSSTGTTHLGPVLSPEELGFLSRQGFTSRDALLWASILSEKDTAHAAHSLIEQSYTLNGVTVQSERDIPVFVLSFLLRRDVVLADALRILLTYTLEYLEKRKQTVLIVLDDQHSRRLGPIDRQAIFLLFIRLARHARKVWPPALVSICTIITSHYLPSRELAVDERELFTKYCNSALYLLSLPTSLNPMKSANYQQRAQFDLIRKMTDQKAPLPVLRQGHRALTSVLLRLKKTNQEREWASLKAPSWPPFKQSKTRLDDLKGPEFGISRAGRALQYMQEYGYPLQKIDLAAKVLSGFHYDGSPTIQTREILLDHGDSDFRLWAAMIEATRTLPEAWACFLSYQEFGTRPSSRVYLAMFKKLAFDRMRTKSGTVSHRHGQAEGLITPLPGDGRETFPPPTSPAEALYIPTEPPSIESLFDQMMDDGVKLDTTTLTFLMEHAPSFEFGIKVWFAIQGDNSALLQSSILGASGPQSYKPLILAARRSNLPSLSDQAIASFVKLLCTFPKADTSGLRPITDSSTYSIRRYCFYSHHPFIYALVLTKSYKPSYRPAWNHLISALSNPATIQNIGPWFPQKYGYSHNSATLLLVEETIKWMREAGLDVDTSAFQSICDGAQKAGTAVRAAQHSHEQEYNFSSSKKAGIRLKNRLKNYPLFLRGLFTRLVGVDSRGSFHAERKGPGDRSREKSEFSVQESSKRVDSKGAKPESLLPTFLAVPNPSGLHSFLRALGLFGDYEGIFSLVKWMVSAKGDIQAVAEEELNGKIKFRKLIVGVRALLQSPGKDHRFSNVEWRHEIEPASEELIMLVENEINGVPEWGGWASEEEVERYFTKGQRL